jgi:hypothetical protein
MLGSEHFQHAAGAGAEIEQRFHRPVGDRSLDRLFHRGVGDMQLADAVPFGGVFAEISLRRGRARGAHGGEPFMVARNGRIVRREPRQERAHHLSARALLGNAEESPGAFPRPLDQTGFAKKLQVARDARLRLAQNLGKVGHGQFGLCQQRQDAQPGAFPGGFQGGIQGGEGQVGRLRHYLLFGTGSHLAR